MSVAGVPEGQVTSVRYDAGRAVVTISLDAAARGKVFRDATVRVRPFNGANFLEVDVSPGRPAAGPLPDGSTIGTARSSIPVATDQVLSVLDADTRAYLQLLTEQAGIALHGTGGQLAGALHQLAPLSTEARQIGSMLAERNRLIAQLVGDSTAIFRTLGHRHVELARVLGAATRVLSVTGSRTREIALATRELPAALAQGQATSTAITSLAPELEQALADLAPAATAFTSGLRYTRGAIPSLDRFLNAATSLTRGTATPGRELLRVAQHLGDGIGPAVASYQALEALLRSIVAHEQPISRFSDAISGVTSTQDAYGPLGRVKFIGIQTPTAEDLGLSAAAAGRTAHGHTQLETMLAAALGTLCKRSQPLACVLAVATPGLPGSLVTRQNGQMGLLSKPPGGLR